MRSACDKSEVTGAIQLTRTGVRSRVGLASVACLRREYRRRHYLLVPRFLQSDLLRLIQDQVERTGFQIVRHQGFGRDLRMNQTGAIAALNFLLNDRTLFRFVERIVGCRRIGSFIGGVRRATPGPRNALGWHDDSVGDRIVAITINLSTAPYQGGVLQIRSARSKKVVCEISNTGPGDAVIFPVSSELEHRNTPVSGTTAKTAYSGWFLSKPDFEQVFATKFRSQPSRSTEQAAECGGSVAGITADSVFTVPPEIVSRRMGENTMLLNVSSGETFCLDTIGHEIWGLLSRETSIRAASRTIATKYGVAAREVTNDAEELVAHLLAQRLLKRRVEVPGAKQYTSRDIP